MIPRISARHLKQLSAYYPVVLITGPRQSGKTTLARQEFPDLPYFNLEAPDTRARVEADPRGFLESYPQGMVIDEFQRFPDLVSYIQVFVDEDQFSRGGIRARFILTGSQQLDVMSKVSQSLAGRVGLLKLLPFSIEELRQSNGVEFGSDICVNRANQWMFNGFYPRIYDKRIPPAQLHSDYFSTYVQRDVRALTAVVDSSQFEKFVRLCAGRVGQVLNVQNLAQDLGVTHATAQRWLTVLQASFVVHLLQPYFWRTNKRLTKSPKLYFYDVGLAAWLNGVQSADQLNTHPLRGPLFENLVVMEALKFRLNRGLRDNLYFYRDSDAAEVDLILEFSKGFYPVEIKSGVTVNADYFKGLKHLSKIVGRAPNAGALVYGGDANWIQAQTQIVGFEQVAALMQSCGGAD